MTLEETLLEKIKELEKTISHLTEQNKEYQLLIKNKDLKDAKQDYKDRLFKFIFGNPKNKPWTLSLYNAVHGTAYDDPEEIRFNTIGEAVYMRMKNDVSFIISCEMNLWEHQSTYNPNMPMRFFIYAGRLYEKYISGSDYYQYSSTLQSIPKPVCLCFYNGKKEQPERTILRLSDAYGGNGDIEVIVTMLNINYGKNQDLMEACRPLKEYAWLVDRVRNLQKEKMDLDSAVDLSLEEMPEDFLIRAFLLEHRAEVKNMFLTEYNEEKVMERERAEGLREGLLVGRVKALYYDAGFTIKEISDKLSISESEIQDILDGDEEF